MSLVITMSSEFPQQAGIDMTQRNADRPQTPETSGSLENPQLIGPAHELFKSPLRHQQVTKVSPGHRSGVSAFCTACLEAP